MPPFLIAIIVVVGGLWLLRKAGRTPPAAMRLLLQKLGGGALIAFAGLLMVKGQMSFALGLFAVGMGLLGKASFLPNGLDWSRPAGFKQGEQQPQRGKVSLARDEALAILGLKQGATAEDVKQAHKRLIKDFHPDKGGSDYLAAQINEAKDVLLS
jgi:DnaJ domain